MAIESIAKTLGTGSGIDTTALVQGLVDAQFEARTATLTTREESLTARISAASMHKSNITTFASALATLSKGGTLATQPTSSNNAVVNVSRLANANLTTLNAKVEVRQIAATQTTASTPRASATAAIGQGTLTLSFGTATVADGAMTGFTPGTGTPVNFTIGANNSSLTGIAAAINAANAGVTASILTDADGSRLVLKGATGSTRAFTLTATETPGHTGLSALNIGVGATGSNIGSAAADAIVAVDGVAIRRDSNSISDLVPGVKLDLVSAQPGTVVNIGKTTPTTSLMQAVQDFVETYNQVFSALNVDLDPITGPLRQDSAAKALRRQLQQLTLTPLATGGNHLPNTLAQIGVRTNRDGTLGVDSTALSLAMVNFPDQIEKMFAANGSTLATNNGLSAALNSISTAAASTTRGLGASELNYTKAKADIAQDRATALEKAESMRTRMTRQFASMDARVAAYRSTMTFLEGQIDAWNRPD